MANVLITNKCNLMCPYCFAEDVTCSQQEFITEEQLKLIINMARKTKESLRIIGGEPTLHPNFLNLCRMVMEYNGSIGEKETVIFSNGVMLNKYYEDLKKIGNFHVLINVNDLSNSSYEIQENFAKSIDMVAKDCFKHANFGCNIHLDEKDYDYIFNLVDKYTFDENFAIRLSVVAPAANYKEFSFGRKEEYYRLIKPIYINFLKKCEARNMKISFDCNQIPFCFFSYEEGRLLYNVSQTFDFRNFSCHSAPIDIDQNLNVWPCFGRKSESINISDYVDFINLAQLREQFTKNRKSAEDCSMDKKVECVFCTGGCAAFKEEEK